MANILRQHSGFVSKSTNVYQEQRTVLGISTIENEDSTLPKMSQGTNKNFNVRVTTVL